MPQEIRGEQRRICMLILELKLYLSNIWFGALKTLSFVTVAVCLFLHSVSRDEIGVR